MSKTCNRCESEIIWGPYDPNKKSRPLNPDNSVHSCMKTEPAQSKITESKPAPAKSPNSILDECIEFEQTFQDLTDAKFDSLVRLYNTRVMQK